MPQASFTPDQLKWLKADPRRFISGLRIVNPEGRYIYFNDPHWEQRAILDALLSDARQITILKCRQIGASTVVLAWLFAQTYWSPNADSALLTSHFASSAETLWGRLRSMADGLPAPLRRQFSKLNWKTMQFATGARIKILSAASPAGARSDTFSTLINDETGHWAEASGGDEKALMLWGDIMSTAHEGARIVTLGTPNGAGENLLFKRAVNAQKLVAEGRRDVRFLFFPWQKHRKYRKEPPPGWERTQEEHELALLLGLDDAQLYWRREKIDGIDGIGIERFLQEYPSTPSEAFVPWHGGFFDVRYLQRVEAVLAGEGQPTGELRLYQRQPETGALYVVGVDPSLCSGGDYAVAQVLDDAGKQCAVLSTNTGSVETFTDKVAELSEHFNRARVIVESNAGGGGNIVIERLRRLGIKLWERPLEAGERAASKFRPWVTSHGSKEAAYSHLRQMVNGDLLDLHDLPTVQELTHIRHEDGTIEGRDGMHDDHAMALALAAWALRGLPKSVREPRYTPKKRAAPDPWAATRR